MTEFHRGIVQFFEVNGVQPGIIGVALENGHDKLEERDVRLLLLIILLFSWFYHNAI